MMAIDRHVGLSLSKWRGRGVDFFSALVHAGYPRMVMFEERSVRLISNAIDASNKKITNAIMDSIT